jgi:hypothetical protein
MRPTVGQILSGLAVTSVATAMLAAPERVLVTPQERSVPSFELQLADKGTVVRAQPVRPARVVGKQRRAVVRHAARQAQPIAIAISRPLPARPQQPPPRRRVPPRPKPTPTPPATTPPPTAPPPAAPPPPAPPPVVPPPAPPPVAPPPIPVVAADPDESEPARPRKPKKEKTPTRDGADESRTSDDSPQRGRGHERKKKHRGADN